MIVGTKTLIAIDEILMVFGHLGTKLLSIAAHRLFRLGHNWSSLLGELEDLSQSAE